MHVHQVRYDNITVKILLDEQAVNDGRFGFSLVTSRVSKIK